MVRAEAVLRHYLREHAPATAHLWTQPDTMPRIRQQVQREWHDRLHDLSGLRRETIRRALVEAGDDPALAESAFEHFFEARQHVDLYEDSLDALSSLAARYPLVALSNGNADVHRVGLGQHFHAAISAQAFGVAKPDPRIFIEAARLAGVSAADVLHVGDDPHLDVVGARAVGMQCAWINRHDQTWPDGSDPPHTFSTLRDLVDHLAA